MRYTISPERSGEKGLYFLDQIMEHFEQRAAGFVSSKVF